MNLNIEWQNPNQLWLLLIIPILVMLLIINQKWIYKTREGFADVALLNKLFPNNTLKINLPKNWFFFLSILLIVFGIIGPLSGFEKTTIKKEGIDIVYVLDISSSMDAQDVLPSRLEKGKKIITESINKLSGDRISIVLFAGSAYNLLPLTNDYATSKIFLSNIETDLISEQGTNYSLAINEALNAIPKNTTSDKVIYLLSDGEDHNKNLESVLEECTKQNIKIFTTSIGSLSGAPIPIKEEGRIIDYKKDANNQTVISIPNPTILKEIATKTNGKFISDNITIKVVNSFNNSISGFQKGKAKNKEVVVKKHQYQWLIIFAILFLLIEMNLNSPLKI